MFGRFASSITIATRINLFYFVRDIATVAIVIA